MNKKFEHKYYKKKFHDHKFWKENIKNFNKKHKKFSRKVFLTFGLFTIIVLFTANILITGVFSIFRYSDQKILFRKKIKKIEKLFIHNSEEQNVLFLKNLIYDDIYSKLILKKNNRVIYDSYSEFLNKHNKIKTIIPILSKEINIDSKYKLYIVKDTHGEQKLIKNYIFLMFIINLFFMIIIMKISKALTFRLLIPINHIIKTAEKIDADHLSDRVAVLPLDDEISRLGRVINKMMDRIEQSFNIQKRFVSDASHELRTPLQIIKGYTDLALKKGFYDKNLLEECLINVKSEIENMTDLTENLLFLAKSEGKNINFKKENVNLFDLFSRIKNDITLVEKNIIFNIYGNHLTNAFIDEKLMLQAFRAVIENSIKYSNENKIINIKFENNNQNTIIEIKDKGIGIPKESLDKIFDRFYRVDEARSKEISGTGLGLSIVKNIVALHGGTIQLESQINKGTSVIFNIPCIE